MSTYLYVECRDHDPLLASDGEVGQHLYDLPAIRRDIADREVLVRLNAESQWGLDLGHHFRNNTLRFLIAHPRCNLGIRDEYGVEYPVVEAGEAP